MDDLNFDDHKMLICSSIYKTKLRVYIIYMNNDNMLKTALDISNLKRNDIQHDELSADLVERIKVYKEILADVEPSSLEEALDDFKRDRNPEKEVRVWEKIALTYSHYCEANPKCSINDKKHAYAKALLESTQNSPLIVG